jgi:adenylate kinase family enzyme
MRIMIIGRPGSGKSTYGHQLSQELSIPVHHLDKHFFMANWTPRNYDEFLAIQQNLIDQDQWIIEGCSIRSLEMRYAEADICIYLTTPRWLCLYRLIKRLFFNNKHIDDRAEGCVESLSWNLIKYTWTFNYRRNHFVPNELAYLRKQYPDVTFYTVRTKRECQQLTTKLKALR